MSDPLVIPIIATPYQSFRVNLAGQDVAMSIYAKDPAMFCDVSLAGRQIVNGMICLDRVGIVRNAYSGFVGQLAIVDTQGTDNPDYTGLGSRFVLFYYPA